VEFLCGILGLNVESWESIQYADYNLNAYFEEAARLANQEYPTRREGLETAITTLRRTRERYEERTRFLSESMALGAAQIERYRIDFLWTTLGTYATNQGLILTLDLNETPMTTIDDVTIYDLYFRVRGDYLAIVNFLYNIEGDERLRFRIENFVIAPTITFAAMEAAELEAEEEDGEGVNTGRPDRVSHEASDALREHAPPPRPRETTPVDPNDTTLTATFRVREIGVQLNQSR